LENIVFYFSGTGNCLKVAKTIAKELDNTEIVSMANTEQHSFSGNHNSIGFVYPVYFTGIPNIVKHFIGNLSINATIHIYTQ
jgi:flavodoxin